MRVVLATYNIHRCIGADGVCDPERTMAVIRSLDADVIALQEVESPGQTGIDFLNHMAHSSDLSPIAGPTLLRDSHNYGNAVLTRAQVTAIRRYGLAHAGREPRGALDLDLIHQAFRFQLIATHLGLRPWERRLQIQRLLRLFPSGAMRPTVLLGDINEWLPWGRPLRWLHGYFGKQPAPATFPARFPLLALDRIWVHPASALKKIEIPNGELARTASDHLPVRAVVEWT